MKKRWIPFIIACTITAFIFGLRIGARTEAEQHQNQPAQETVNSTIAVVNADAGVELNGIHLNYAAAIIDTLDYRFALVSPAMAQTGLTSSMYSAVVTFPSNVSTRILTFNAYQPQRVLLDFVISPGLSDREFLQTHLAITELQLAINNTLASTYVSSILRQFHYAQDHVGSVFYNTIADLMALEFLTLGNFTDGLDLDIIPQIPLNPRELDTEFYFGQVYAFAADIAGWYLRSYEMATDQFLWMREGLFDLTANFPEQENSWLLMLEDWTWYSEEYGRLLELYAEYVSTHDKSLYEWFNENTRWHEDLGYFQFELADWHYDSLAWFDVGELWYTEYVDYLLAVVLFEYALEAFRMELDENSLEVQDELEEWRLYLEEFMLNLYRQANNLIRDVEIYNDHVYDSTVFLERMENWHESLLGHYNVFVDWLFELNDRQDDLNFFLRELLFNQNETEFVSNELMQKINDFPAMPDFMPPELNLDDDWMAIYIPTITAITLPDWDTGTSPDFSPLLPISVPAPPLPMGPISSLPMLDINFLPLDDLFMTTLSYYQILQLTDWYLALQDNVWNQVLGCESDLQGWITQTELQVEYAEEQILYWHSNVLPIEGYLAQRRDELEAQRTKLEDIYDEVNTMQGVLRDFYLELNPLHGSLNTLHTDLHAIYQLLFAWNADINEHFSQTERWYNRLRLFADELYQFVMPGLPEPRLWEYLVSPEETHPGSLYHLLPLGLLPLPIWNDEILTPPPYDGTQIRDALEDQFPLGLHVLSSPFDLMQPPAYTGVSQPYRVDGHFMMTAEIPHSPLKPPPPRPDDFWHSLNFMHDQLLRFDVGAFLSDDIHRMVDNSLQSYDVFLGQLRGGLSHTFQDNVLRMYEVHDEYTHFLWNLRHDAFDAHDAEHYALQSAIYEFAMLREQNVEDNMYRLGAFATMMPETRGVGGINQSVIDFTVSPFEFAAFDFRYNELLYGINAQTELVTETFDRFFIIALIIAAAVFVVTAVVTVVLYFVKKRKHIV